MFVRATLDDGSQIITEFRKLSKLRKLAGDVMRGSKALPVWKKAGERLEHNNEPALIRTRTFVNGSTVRLMEKVVPTVEDHQYDPENFEPAPIVEQGRNGSYTAPEGAEEDGLVVGAEYPIHRDDEHRRYVLRQAAEGRTPEDRHYLDPERGGSSMDFDDEDEYEDDWDDEDDEF